MLTPTASWKQTFQYDRYGNKNFDEVNTTTLTQNCGTAPNLTICDIDRKVENPEIEAMNNRIKELQPDGDSVKDYEYDTSGNTIKDAKTRTFIYDGENKQIEVRNSSGNPIGQYYFDGAGKRVMKVVPATGETTVFHYDAGGKLIAEYSSIVEPVAMATVSYLTNDHLGSPRITTNKDGDIISRRDFMPFGEEITSTHTSQRTTGVGYGSDNVRQNFTGYERDKEIGLDFAQARMYSDMTGRFTTVDPIFISKSRIMDPQRINLFVYGRNSPFKYVDVTGMDIVLADDLSKKDRKYAIKHLARYYMTDQGKRTLDKLDKSKFVIVFTVTKPGKLRANGIDMTKSSSGTELKTGETTETHNSGKTNYSVTAGDDGEVYLVAKKVGEESTLKPVTASIDADEIKAAGGDPAVAIAHELEGHTGKLIEEAEKSSEDAEGYPLGNITKYDGNNEDYPLQAEKEVKKQLKKIKKPSKEAIEAVEKIVKAQ